MVFGGAINKDSKGFLLGYGADAAYDVTCGSLDLFWIGQARFFPAGGLSESLKVELRRDGYDGDGERLGRQFANQRFEDLIGIQVERCNRFKAIVFGAGLVLIFVEHIGDAVLVQQEDSGRHSATLNGCEGNL